MIPKENNPINTDQAWQRLHARLEQDGLLTAETSASKVRLFSSPAMRWAAAIALLCICAATAFFLFRKGSGDGTADLLTLHNEKGSVTLVTTLEDGSIVYLADDTQLRYPEHFAPEKREVSLRGNALFDVSGNSERPFLIETELISIEVIGTAFNVESTDPNSFVLSVRHGEVKVTAKQSGESLHVRTGETVTLLANRLHVAPTQAEAPFATFEGRIRFKDEKLENILTVLNKRGGETELRTTTSLANRQLTATFDNDAPEDIAELICTAFHLSCHKENNVLMISEP